MIDRLQSSGEFGARAPQEEVQRLGKPSILFGKALPEGWPLANVVSGLVGVAQSDSVRLIFARPSVAVRPGERADDGQAFDRDARPTVVDLICRQQGSRLERGEKKIPLEVAAGGVGGGVGELGGPNDGDP